MTRNLVIYRTVTAVALAQAQASPLKRHPLVEMHEVAMNAEVGE
jgi:hypothetical protein